MSQKIDKSWGYLLELDDGTQVEVIKDRREYVKDEDWSLQPNSLVGSWFHVLEEGRMIWQGVIVAEPAQAQYLCQIDVLEQGVERVQRLFSLDTLMGLGEDAKRLIEGAMDVRSAPVVTPNLEWRLYDNEATAQAAFANHHAARLLIESEVEQ
jgi:hypothetical protein